MRQKRRPDVTPGNIIDEKPRRNPMDFTAPVPLIAAWILIAPLVVVALLSGMGGGRSDSSAYRVRHDDPVTPPLTR